MSATTHPQLFTAADLAAYSGVKQEELKNHEPEGFGSPGHWRMVGNDVVYTAAGARLLAQSIAMAGNEEGACSLLSAVNQIEAAASRPAFSVAKPARSDWRNRADLQ